MRIKRQSRSLRFPRVSLAQRISFEPFGQRFFNRPLRPVLADDVETPPSGVTFRIARRNAG